MQSVVKCCIHSATPPTPPSTEYTDLQTVHDTFLLTVYVHSLCFTTSLSASAASCMLYEREWLQHCMTATTQYYTILKRNKGDSRNRTCMMQMHLHSPCCAFHPMELATNRSETVQHALLTDSVLALTTKITTLFILHALLHKRVQTVKLVDSTLVSRFRRVIMLRTDSILKWQRSRHHRDACILLHFPLHLSVISHTRVANLSD
jgi:hypothetical protein